MSELPQVILDTTLANLYRQAGSEYANKRIAQVLCGVNAGFNLTLNFPRNVKYVYQDGSFNSVRETTSVSAEVQHKRQLAMKYLSLIPQRDAFICGDTSVILFHLGDTPQSMAHDKDEAERTLRVLVEDQRPNLLFCAGPGQIPVEDAEIDMIAHKIMLDDLESYSLVVQPEVHWFLNSKLALARSGLPTPECSVIEITGHLEKVGKCCAACQTDPLIFPVPTDCSGVRGEWLEDQSVVVYEALQNHPLPFVLKNQQTFGGAGTYMIRTEEDRRQVLEDFRGGVLRKLLSSVTYDNVHLSPSSLILSKMVQNPIGDFGLTFFVTKKDHDPIFLAASEQMTDGNGVWIGSTINYKHQDELKRKFGPLVQRIAAWLQSYGYVGPAGADVLETEPKSANARERNETSHTVLDEPAAHGDYEMSHFHIVDLNVRTSGSLCLPLLRHHFTSRGLYSASSSSISTRKDRSSFIAHFQVEFSFGSMCILSWFEDVVSGISLADIAIGAEDDESLRRAMKKVGEVSDSVTF